MPIMLPIMAFRRCWSPEYSSGSLSLKVHHYRPATIWNMSIVLMIMKGVMVGSVLIVISIIVLLFHLHTPLCGVSLPEAANGNVAAATRPSCWSARVVSSRGNWPSHLSVLSGCSSEFYVPCFIFLVCPEGQGRWGHELHMLSSN